MKSAMDYKPNFDDLILMGNLQDKGGLTKVGRSLQKHESRNESLFSSVKGNCLSINFQGEKVLREIIECFDTTCVIRYHARFENILEIKNPSGQGARFGLDNKTFIGFNAHIFLPHFWLLSN
jgi:hypothetical protein